METNTGFVAPVLPEVQMLRESANHVASCIFYNSEVEVKGVELFGSLARGNGDQNSDIDMIIHVDGFIAAYWIHTFQQHYRNSRIRVRALRREAAIEVLGLDTAKLERFAGESYLNLDLFVYPANWKDLKTYLAGFWHRWDQRFLDDIAEDTIPFIPGVGFRFPAKPKPDPIRMAHVSPSSMY